MLLLISGCSGSGKNTIIKKLMERNENIKFLKSCTTRKPRPNEDNYIYLTKEDFDNRDPYKNKKRARVQGENPSILALFVDISKIPIMVLYR